MDTQVITAFARAGIETFRTMCRLEVAPKQAKVKGDRTPGEGIHAIIGMNGAVEGACALSVVESTAFALIERMTGHYPESVDRDVIEGIQEIDNVIIGLARRNLQGSGLDFVFGLPKTMSGILFSTDEGPQYENLGIIFDTEVGRVLMGLHWKLGG
ncbi:MAG: chemotaxis protein CheX [Planctomycetota bacterium]|jgi:CheY-specific phosphatase CheX|nr:chemotaxis protein CheX [Planctomycetota bacterium]